MDLRSLQIQAIEKLGFWYCGDSSEWGEPGDIIDSFDVWQFNYDSLGLMIEARCGNHVCCTEADTTTSEEDWDLVQSAKALIFQTKQKWLEEVGRLTLVRV